MENDELTREEQSEYTRLINGAFSTFLRDRYETYLSCSTDGKGNDRYTSEPLKTFEEWLGPM